MDIRSSQAFIACVARGEIAEGLDEEEALIAYAAHLRARSQALRARLELMDKVHAALVADVEEVQSAAAVVVQTARHTVACALLARTKR